MTSRVFEVVRAMSGVGNTITIPCPYLDFFAGDRQQHLLAAILNQMVFWSGKSHLEDGWFYKEHAALASEVRASSEDVVRKAINKILTQYLPGVIEEKKCKINGTPKMHYRINEEALIALIFPSVLDSALEPNGNGSQAEWKRPLSRMETAHEPNPGNGSQAESILYTDLKNRSLHTDLNPTHNRDLVKPVRLQQVPDYPGQPGVIFPAAAQVGKFPMHAGWQPSTDFHRMAALWGRPVPAGINLTAELNSFIAYWQAESKVFMQVQWEQKFANHLQRAGADKRQSRGSNHGGLDAGSTANAAVQQIRAARAQQQRSRGPGVDVLGGHGGNLFQPVDGQKRSRALQSLDGTNREPDNGADGQYLQCPDSPLRCR